MKKKINLKELRSIIKKVLREEITSYDIIGLTAGEVFPEISGINMIENKVIQYAKKFEPEPEKDFDAIRKAEDYLRENGYDKGSMYFSYPIPFMIKGKTGIDDDGTTLITTKHGEIRPLVITKFDRLSMSNWDDMDGAIISDDFRNGTVYLIFFNFPE